MIGFIKAAVRSVHPIAIALSALATVVVLGCGDDSGLARRYKVSGRVTYKGEPVAHGTVNFNPTNPAPPEGRAATGDINDGYYQLSTVGNYDGALPGEYGVAIIALDIDLKDAAAANKGGQIHQGDLAHQKAVKAAKTLLPAKYGTFETSKLTAKVAQTSNTIDFPLSD
jgi:hypothetical protein